MGLEDIKYLFSIIAETLVLSSFILSKMSVNSSTKLLTANSKRLISSSILTCSILLLGITISSGMIKAALPALCRGRRQFLLRLYCFPPYIRFFLINKTMQIKKNFGNMYIEFYYFCNIIIN
jgi:hypothetical protein